MQAPRRVAEPPPLAARTADGKGTILEGTRHVERQRRLRGGSGGGTPTGGLGLRGSPIEVRIERVHELREKGPVLCEEAAEQRVERRWYLIRC